VLLATNQLQFVAQTDYVIVLANHDGDKAACHIAQQGTYKQLMDVSQDAVSPGSSFKVSHSQAHHLAHSASHDNPL
jgi:hypothetical protein